MKLDISHRKIFNFCYYESNVHFFFSRFPSIDGSIIRLVKNRRLRSREMIADPTSDGTDFQIALHDKNRNIVAYAVVDKADECKTCVYKWNRTKAGYASATTRNNGKREVLLLHQLILGKQAGMVIDHINHNRLDNRRENLRHVTPRDNAANSSFTKKKSRYLGVRFAANCRNRPWFACYKEQRSKYYRTESEAAFAYDMMARKEGATVNGVSRPDAFVDSHVDYTVPFPPGVFWSSTKQRFQLTISQPGENKRRKSFRTFSDVLLAHNANLQVPVTTSNLTSEPNVVCRDEDGIAILKFKKKNVNIPVLVDDDVYLNFIDNTSRWIGRQGYPCIRTQGKLTPLHQILLEPKDGFVIDHKDQNKTNARRSNLRYATRSENTHNQKRQKCSLYSGIWKSVDEKWHAEVWKDGIKYNGGVYSDEKVAAFAYNALASRLFGQFARLNIVDLQGYKIDNDRAVPIVREVGSFIGVSTHRDGTYRAVTYDKGKQIYLGTYTNPYVAGFAYDCAVKSRGLDKPINNIDLPDYEFINDRAQKRTFL